MPAPTKYPGQGTMKPRSMSLTDVHCDTARRIGGTVAAGAQMALDAVSLLTPEQCAWLAEYGDTAKALADAVQQAIDMERAEAEAEALAPTYNGGRW